MRSCGWHASRRDTVHSQYTVTACARHVPSHPIHPIDPSIPLTHPLPPRPDPRAPTAPLSLLPPGSLYSCPRRPLPSLDSSYLSLFILSLPTINHSPTGSVLDRTSSSDLSFSLPSPSPPLCNDTVASHGRGQQDVRWQCRLQQLPFVNPDPDQYPDIKTIDL